MHKETQAALWLTTGVLTIHKGLHEQETAMPDPRQSEDDEIKAARAEVEFQQVAGIARTRRDRGELSAGAYTVILERARNPETPPMTMRAQCRAGDEARPGSRGPRAEASAAKGRRVGSGEDSMT
ncbi:hypothetical protein [Acidisoma sp. S159]|uniref:hypothetical protein n=1 Tax=Acidisoma sp. S159 TaxID=1747225 RepID=UPI00131CE2FD|nr:hypothetical protein [Acidisoma sp. S159]